MSFIPKPHEIYKHFKGNLYQITAIAEHTETGEALVVYQAMYGDFKTYARPLSMFVSRVDRAKYPDAAQEFRFELQGPESARQRAEMEPELRESMMQRAEARSALKESTEQKAEAESEPKLKESTAQKVQAEPEAVGAPAPKRSGEELTEGELMLDPMVLEFLDADSYEKRLNILAGLHHRITDEMITTMAIACDVEINDGETEERYEALKNCLITLERYECQRIR